VNFRRDGSGRPAFLTAEDDCPISRQAENAGKNSGKIIKGVMKNRAGPTMICRKNDFSYSIV